MLILSIRFALAMFIRRMVLPYASLYILAVGGDNAQIGIVTGLLPLAGLIMFPISGYLTDSAGRVRLIALSGYLSASIMLLFLFAPSWEWIAFGTLLQGFMVFEFPPTSAILADSLEPRNRGVGLATMNALSNGFAIFSPFIAGMILEVYGNNIGMRLIYGLYGLQYLVNATIVIRYLNETTPIEKSGKIPSISTILKEAYGGIPELLRNMPRRVKALGVVLGSGFIANGIASPFWVVYATKVIGLSNIEWGLILLIESITKTMLTIPFGLIADKYSRTKTLFAATVVSLFSLPTLIFASTFRDVLLIRMGVGVAGALFFPASTALMADFVPRELRGRVMAAIGRGSILVGAAGGGTGGPGMGYFFTIMVMTASILGGMLYSMNPIYPWICVFGTVIVQIICVTLFIRDPEKEEK